MLIYKRAKRCKDCGLSSFYHFQTWLEGLINQFTPFWLLKILPGRLQEFFNVLLEKILIFLKLASLREDFNYSDIQLRSACFIEEAKKQGIEFKALYGPFGYTSYFQAKFKNKTFRFDSLPVANFLNKYPSQIIDDKKLVKEHLKKENFPVAEGRAFWFWQKRKAIDYGLNKLKFPLVVKPRDGSVSRHVTTNIRDPQQLNQAINKVISYSPCFIVETFFADTFVFRTTVIDFDFVACVKQIPANIVSDGLHTIRELIDIKNSEFTFYKIVENETTKELLKDKGYNFSSIPKKGEMVYLQKDPFLKLGGDLVEVTDSLHPDNLQLFRDIAKFFDVRVVGIDFLVQDISVSWKNQTCAVLELNSAPCIEMHHFPSSGKPQNVAAALVDLVFRCYL
jgi:D-alanine-D-alanine ligase-like ATP-grasp enzyme